MQAMKLPQFSLRTLLLSTVAIALMLWGLIEWHNVEGQAVDDMPGPFDMLLVIAALASCCALVWWLLARIPKDRDNTD
jgi:hypothetical protein